MNFFVNENFRIPDGQIGIGRVFLEMDGFRQCGSGTGRAGSGEKDDGYHRIEVQPVDIDATVEIAAVPPSAGQFPFGFEFGAGNCPPGTATQLIFQFKKEKEKRKRQSFFSSVSSEKNTQENFICFV